MNEISQLVAGIFTAKALPNDSLYPSDAYAFVLVNGGRDALVRGNRARPGPAWRRARQSFAKRRIRSGDAAREFTARGT